MTDKKLLSDHFTPWSASPHHLLHPFMQSIMPTTILVLGHIEKGKQNLEHFTSNKTKTSKHQTFWENVWFWLNFFFGFPSCFVYCLKWTNKKQLFFVFCMGIINQDIKKQKNSRSFVAFETSQCRKPRLTFWKANGFLTSWLIISITKNKTQLFFVFPFQTKNNWGNPQKPLSQNLTFSQKFFLFCSSSLFFVWFVFWFTWLPSVSVCLLTLSFLGSQTLTSVSHSRACALCETKLGIGCAKQCLCTWKLAVSTLSCSISSNLCAILGILESYIHIPVWVWHI